MKILCNCLQLSANSAAVMSKPPIISLWSGPRNVSTALMYSFGQRPDIQIVDEPLYGYYLNQTGVNHPGADEVLATMNLDQSQVWEHVTANREKILFLKNMAHHALDLSDQWYDIPVPVFLIRDPREMLPSLTIQLPQANLRDTGLKRQAEMLQMFNSMGKTPIVIDSKTLLLHPEGVLKKVCQQLDIPFFEQMLRWKAGPRDEDGIWAKYWYHAVHASTGFQKYIEKREPFPEHLTALLDECQPYYEQLVNQAIS